MLCYMHRPNYIESSAPLKKPRDFKLWYFKEGTQELKAIFKEKLSNTI